MAEHLKPHWGQTLIELGGKNQKISQGKRQQHFAEYSKGVFQVV